eukprot:g1016.t1
MEGSSSHTQANVGLIVNRLAHSVGESRLETLQELSKLIRENFASVGRVGIPVLVKVLQEERNEEVVLAVLDALTTLVTASRTSSEDVKRSVRSHAEILLESKNLVEKILVLLKQDRFWLRVKAIQLLGALATILPDRVGKMVLAVEAGMLRLVEVLNDKREEVRNELLLLLRYLTETNAEIQQFCAFQQVFTHLLAIMVGEGLVEGGAVVNDCLQIVLNCVSRNAIVRKMFLEPGQTLLGILPILRKAQPAGASSTVAASGGGGGGRGGETTKTNGGDRFQQYQNLSHPGRTVKGRVAPPESMRTVLKIVSSLVTPSPVPKLLAGGGRLDDATRRELARREAVQLERNQSTLAKLGYLNALASLSLDYDSAAADRTPIRVEAIDTLGRVIRGNERVFAMLEKIAVTLRMGAPALPASACLMHLVLGGRAEANVKRGHSLRDAATRALCLAVATENAASTWIGHAMSSSPHMLASGHSSVASASSTGRLLIERMIEAGFKVLVATSEIAKREALWSHWRSARIFEHALDSGGETARMLALRISVSGGAPSSSQDEQQNFLLHRCLRLLSLSSEQEDEHAIVVALQCSLLRLLTAWLWMCPRAVDEVVDRAGNLFLYDILGSSKTDERVRQWCCVLVGTFMLYATEGRATTPRDILNIVTNRAGLRNFTDALVAFERSPALAAAKRLSRKMHSKRHTVEDSDPIFSTESEMRKGCPPSVDFTVAPRLCEALASVPRRMIELYGRTPGSSLTSSKRDEGGAPSSAVTTTRQNLSREHVDSLQHTVSLLKALLVMEERVRSSSSKGDDDATTSTSSVRNEPEVVRIVFEYEEAVRLRTEVETKAENDTRRHIAESLELKQKLDRLRRENEELKHQVVGLEHAKASADARVSSTASASRSSRNLASVARVDEGRNGSSFMDGISGAMETFAETESLKSKVTRLSDRLCKMEVENDGLKKALDAAKSDLATKSAAAGELKALKEEHVDLLTLLGRVETLRISLGEALERVAGPKARKNAENVAFETASLFESPPRKESGIAMASSTAHSTGLGDAVAAGDFI